MKTIGIEAFLRWVYREELPKAEAPGTGSVLISQGLGSGWDAVSRQGALMTECVSDGRVNTYGVVPLSAWYGVPPHDDALTAHRAVSELAEMELGLPEDWSPLGGLGLGPDEERSAVERAMPRLAICGEDGVWRLRLKPAELIRRHAILGGAPSWEAERPKARFVTIAGMPGWFRTVTETIRGKPFEREVNGFDPRSRRPYPGAYRKTILEPDPVMAVIDRAEYEVWHAALCLLVETLSGAGQLVAHAVLPPACPARPWDAVCVLEESA